MSALALALFALVGCGSSDKGVADKSAQEILSASKEAAEGASSVHVVGRSSQGLVSLSIDLRLSSSGGRGRVSLLGLDYEMVRIGDTVYVKGTPAFYERIGRILGKTLNVPKGTWLKAPATGSPLTQLAALVDLPRQVGRLLSTSDSVTKGASTTVNGQKAIEVKETAKVYKGALYVAAVGKPYPLALVKTKGKGKNEREGGRTTFSEWDQPVSLAAPSPWVDVETLRK